MDYICEICGERKATKKVFIEGALLYVCNKCAKGLGKEQKIAKRMDKKTKHKYNKDRIESIVDNYAELIKNARKEKGISLEDLAKALKEKESYLRHIEKGEMIPNLKLAKKLEHFLNIKLIQRYELSYDEHEENIKKEIKLSDIAEVEDGS